MQGYGSAPQPTAPAPPPAPATAPAGEPYDPVETYEPDPTAPPSFPGPGTPPAGPAPAAAPTPPYGYGNPAAPDASQGVDDARLVAIQMAASGRTRGQVREHLHNQMGLGDTRPILDEIFGAGSHEDARVPWTAFPVTWAVCRDDCAGRGSRTPN